MSLLARRRTPIAVVVVSGVLVVAGCGSSSEPGSAGKTASSATSSLMASGLTFSKCMRSHGEPTFPDPNAAGGGFQLTGNGKFRIRIGPRGTNGESPAFQAAISACQNLFPPISGGSGEQHPSAATMTQMLAVARCMRAHGVPNWPDPTTYLPSSPNGYAEIIDHNGAVFLIPTSIDTRSPAVKQAATACQVP
jgi:hypothetical protein